MLELTLQLNSKMNITHYEYQVQKVGVHTSSGKQLKKVAQCSRPAFTVPMVCNPPGCVPNKCAPGFSRYELIAVMTDRCT